MPPAAIPNVRVVVRLPENRPQTPLHDPPKIEWTPEKADILWKVIERSRTSDNGGTDWKGLAAHLEVPLPYLLYRAEVRFQEDLRGLQDIAVTSPLSAQPPSATLEEFPHHDQPHTLPGRNVSKLSGSTRLSTSSGRTSTPLGIRARLNSLGSRNATRSRRDTSSSTLTLQEPLSHARTSQPNIGFLPSDDENDSEDEEMLKEEEAERMAEEQEALNQKLRDLHKMMTNEALGLVTSNRTRRRSNDRSRMFSSRSSYRQDPLSSASVSHSVSGASSPPGSIPDIPSPSADSQSHSPVRSPVKYSSSPPASSPRGLPHRRYPHLMHRNNSEQESVNNSEASSFSDISDASLSGSAMESAYLSNFRSGGNSRFSVASNYARSKFGGRSALPH
ncbi:hypothetical protein PQX77_004796 [Marasmius sp. AFHP31]|nr:hypothetical protein PQX77_004796 [Marasmius sp. AFHP31]